MSNNLADQPAFPTCYIVTPISTPPEKDGPYQLCYFDGEVSDFKGMFKEGKWQKIPDKFFSYLRPINLSTLLGEAMEQGSLLRRKHTEIVNNHTIFYDVKYQSDKEAYINSIINPAK